MSEEGSNKLAGIDVGLEIPGVGGAHVKVAANETLVKYVTPDLYRAQQSFDAIIRGIHLKQDRGEDLTLMEQQVLAVSVMPVLSGKLQNVAAVIGYAQQYDADFGKYVQGKVPSVEAPKALPPHDANEELDIEVTVEEQEKEYWWDRFWADAEGVSVGYMRRLLGQIAARKARTPKGISLRTIDVVRCLEAETLKTFETVCRYVIDGRGIPEWNAFETPYAEAGIKFGDLLPLQEAQLIALDDISMGFTDVTLGDETIKVVESNPQVDEGFARLPVTTLTKAGHDLWSLFNVKPTPKEARLLVRYVLRQTHVPLQWRANTDAPFVPIEKQNPPPLIE